MKTTYATLLSLLITVTQALASSSGPEGEGLSLLATFFIGFGILIIMFQFVPGMLLLFGMLKGLFSSADKKLEDSLVSGSSKTS